MNVCTGDEVFARCSDGIAYVGIVTEVDSIRREVEVKFEDGECFWTRLSDLRLRVKKKSSTERCRGCLQLPNNHNTNHNLNGSNLSGVCPGLGANGNLVICQECNEAFHPECHVPKEHSLSETFSDLNIFLIMSHTVRTRLITNGSLKMRPLAALLEEYFRPGRKKRKKAIF